MKKDNYTILFEEKNHKLDLFLELIKENQYYARVHCINNNGFHKISIILFEETNGDFAIVKYRTKYNISKTNKVYFRKTKEASLIYKNKKFWFSDNTTKVKKFRALTMNDLYNFSNYPEGVKDVQNYLTKKFPWVRFISEHNINNVALNYFINNKLYSLNDFLRFYFKLPINVIGKIIDKKNNLDFSFVNLRINKSKWDFNKKYLINIENIREEFINDPMFADTIRLAHILDKKVNSSWSIRRLHEEHDKWSKEHREITILLEKEYKLNVGSHYKIFAKLFNYTLLDKNTDLIREGMEQNHCVATYIDRVHNGRCGIYHIKGYTLELQTKFNGLYISQFRGKHNVNVPDELRNEVEEKLKEMNEKHFKKENISELIEEHFPF
jgi:hypothetical protein